MSSKIFDCKACSIVISIRDLLPILNEDFILIPFDPDLAQITANFFISHLIISQSLNLY